jgi:hypothetical protein
VTLSISIERRHEMTPDEIQAELLAQHQDLRKRIQQIRGSRQLDPRKELVTFHVKELIAELLEALAEHNRCEEALLADLLPAVDAWGSVRKERMAEQHQAEHMTLCGAFATVTVISDSGVAAGLLGATLDCIVEHMEREEKTFLDDLALGVREAVMNQFTG